MTQINITFPNGDVKSYSKNITSFEVAKSISPSLAKRCIIAKFNDVAIDLAKPLTEDGILSLVTDADELGLETLRHSAAHVLALALTNLYPGCQLAIGPSIEEGFYYDLDVKVKEEDLPALEKEMAKIIKHDLQFENSVVSKEEALEIFKDNKFKTELINEIEEDTVTIYSLGEFKDLCRGPHVPSTRFIKAFKLLSLAGAYWRGDSSNDMLQRIYGTAFFTNDDLQNHLEILQLRKDSDHRKFGKELDLFFLDDLAGRGLPLWTNRGTAIKRELERFVVDEELKAGYKHISTPVLGNVELYKTSGHYQHYIEDMFPVMEREDEAWVLRPMTCPHACLMYKHKLRSYRDLPLRYAELGWMHRYEKSGALSGLERVRGMVLTDAHTLIRPDQIEGEIANILKLMDHVFSTLKVKPSYYRLSLRDPNDKEKYFDDDAMWNSAESSLRTTLNDLGLDFVEAEDEAAFYGPKLDIQIKTVLGHDITLATIQLDFLLPGRFGLTYVDQNNEKQTPVMIHRGLIGTLERFVAYILEEHKGVLPFWLSPTQIDILPVNVNAHLAHAQELKQTLLNKGFRVELDSRDEKLGYKLRESQTSKNAMAIIVGDEEMVNNTVTFRNYGETTDCTMSVNEFITHIENLRTNKI